VHQRPDEDGPVPADLHPPDGEALAEGLLGLGVLPLGRQDRADRLQALGVPAVAVAVLFLAYGEALACQRLGGLEVPLVALEFGEVVKDDGVKAFGATAGGLADRQGAVEQRLGLVQFIAIHVQAGQVVEGIGHVDVRGPEGRLAEGQEPFAGADGLGILALDGVNLHEAGQGHRQPLVVGAERLGHLDGGAEFGLAPGEVAAAEGLFGGDHVRSPLLVAVGGSGGRLLGGSGGRLLGRSGRFLLGGGLRRRRLLGGLRRHGLGGRHPHGHRHHAHHRHPRYEPKAF